MKEIRGKTRKLRMTGLTALLLSVCLAAGCGTGGQKMQTAEGGNETAALAEKGTGQETSSPGSDKRYKISYVGPFCTEYEPGNYVEKLITDAVDIDLEVLKIDNANTETLNVLFASGEMPDCGWFGMSPDFMYSEELVRTIPRDMVETYAPTLIEKFNQYPVLYAQTLDPDDDSQFRYLTGLTFQFVNYYLPNDYYRYDWILDLGIDLGVNVEQISDNIYVADDGITVDKFQEIMEKFVNNDPDGNGADDTVGVNAPNITQGPFFSGFGFRGGINEVDGKPVQWYATPGYKEYLKFFQKMYADGLVDPEMLTAKAASISWDRVNSRSAGYWITSTNSLQAWAAGRPPLTLLEKEPDCKILMTPGLKPEGGEVMASVNASPSYGQFYVNKNVDDEKLIKILQFFEYCLFGETRVSHYFGEEGVDWEYDEDGMVKVINTLSNGAKGAGGPFMQYGQDEEISSYIANAPLFNAGLKYWGPDGSWLQLQHIPFKEDIRSETDYSALSTEYAPDIDAYVETYRTQCILGEKDVDATWEEYLSELDRLGYQELMAELDQLPELEDIIADYSK